jgi:hypothetical protein
MSQPTLSASAVFAVQDCCAESSFTATFWRSHAFAYGDPPFYAGVGKR